MNEYLINSKDAKPAEADSAPTTIAANVELLGKSYQIRCQQQEVATLTKAAEFLNETMKTMGGSKTMMPEKVALMAGLNIASQLLELEQQMSQHIHFLNQRLGSLQHKIDSALTSGLELELEPYTKD